MLNKSIIMGRLTAAIELNQTQSGISVYSFTVAVDCNCVSDSQELQTNIINFVAWRQTSMRR